MRKMPGKNQNYNVQSAAENGQYNPGFVYGESGKNDPKIIPVTNGALTSKKVEGPEGREQWDKPIEFLFSCIAMSVGLGNIWRFPFTAYENGGGAFLIPYLVVLFFIGKPMYFLELALGQFSSRGQVKVWKLSPIFKGVGYASAFGTCCVVSYYCMLMAITVFYFFASFQTKLPWTVCNDEWENITCDSNGTVAWTVDNKSGNITEVSISGLYYTRDVLKETNSIDDGIGSPDWRLTLCLLASWLVIFGSLVKGVQSAGKVAYFTALFPYVVLIILLIRGVTLPGALNGIYYFIAPQWEKILLPQVWYAAVSQCFFSLSTGFGPIIMFASYNPFNHNVYRDAAIISLMDTFTSLLAGFTIFAILGNLSFELGKDISEVTGAGASLAFVSYPQAISKFTFAPQLFAVLFFLMLFTLGVGSATSLAGGIITIIHDRFPHIPKSRFTAGVCIVGFLSGLLYVTPGGQFMLTLVDHFGVSFVIFITAAIEMMAISWVYGINNVCRDLEFMLKRKINFYWKMCWGFIVPVGLSVILVYTLATLEPLKHEGHEYPDSAIVCGWILSALALILLPLSALHVVFTRTGDSIKEKLHASLKPSDDWGPSEPAIRQEWLSLPEKTTVSSQIKSTVQRVVNRE